MFRQTSREEAIAKIATDILLDDSLTEEQEKDMLEFSRIISKMNQEQIALLRSIAENFVNGNDSKS